MPRHAVAATPDLTPLDTISTEQSRKLAADIGVPGVDPQQVCNLVNDAADLYRWQLHVADAKRPKPARDSLDRLQAALGEAVAALDQLDWLPRQALDDVLVQRLGQLGAANEGISATRDRVAGLMDAARCARDTLPDGDGRGDVNNLRLLCDQLAGVYWRHQPGAPHKVVRAWVKRVVESVDPKVTDRNLNTVWLDIRKPPPE